MNSSLWGLLMQSAKMWMLHVLLETLLGLIVPTQNRKAPSFLHNWLIKNTFRRDETWEAMTSRVEKIGNSFLGTFISRTKTFQVHQ